MAATTAMVSSNSTTASARSAMVLRGTEGAFYNAENITVTDNRIFVTGSKGIGEVIPAYRDTGGEWVYRVQQIPIATKLNSAAPQGELPADCFLNGIVTVGSKLYVACARVYAPFSGERDWGFSDFPEDLVKSTWIYGSMALGSVKSWIFSADLNGNQPCLRFDTLVATIDNCFANGLAAAGNSLYVANCAPWPRSCIFRIELPSLGAATAVRWHETGPALIGANGIKSDGNFVYYTSLRAMPVEAALIAVPILGKQSAPSDRTLIARFLSVLDDFDFDNNGHFVIADIVDFSLGTDRGALLFFNAAGEIQETFRSDALKRPSSVAVLREPLVKNASGGKVEVLAKGDILVTDKENQCVVLVR